MEYATEFEDLLADPPKESPYEKLKEQLTSRIADSERQKIWLLTAEELGTANPPSCFAKCNNCWVEKSPSTIQCYANYFCNGSHLMYR